MAGQADAAYPWYTLVEDDSLEQGDFFFRFPLFEVDYGLVAAGVSAQVEASLYDVIVLSQSCDLKYGKLESVLVCPHFSLEAAIDANPSLKSSQMRKNLRDGLIPALHVLNACEIRDFLSPPRVVTFKQLFTVPFAYVKKQADESGPRLRLLPPYREQLAQAFARFIMRVGLPVDIPDF